MNDENNKNAVMMKMYPNSR